MPRRRLLGAAALSLAAPALMAGCAVGPARAATALPTDDANPATDAVRGAALINRLTWGLDRASLAEWQRLGERDWLQTQLHPPAVARLPTAVQARLDGLRLFTKPMPDWAREVNERRRALDSSADAEARQAARRAVRQEQAALAHDAAERSLLLAVHSPAQLRERLTWFWFNHFNVYQGKGQLRVMVGDYEDDLRRHALGRFSDLLLASATHAAMLRYLDNDRNAAGRLNENFARELMELHTLGVDGGYTQQDVQALARVLTGLGTDLVGAPARARPHAKGQDHRQGVTWFNPARHDWDDKRLLGLTVSGRGWDEIVAQLLRLARHPSTAQHVSHKLATAFVADQPPPALVESMRQAFVASDGDIAVTLQAMVEAPAFGPSLARKFKDPVRFVVSALRLAGDGAPPMLDTTLPQRWLARLGEGLYERQTPDGYPLQAAAWSGSGQMGLRFEIARAIATLPAGALQSGKDAHPGASGSAWPGFAQPSSPLFQQALWPSLGERSRAALEQARSPAERVQMLLSSPEFMHG